jgi:hypothetical protein
MILSPKPMKTSTKKKRKSRPKQSHWQNKTKNYKKSFPPFKLNTTKFSNPTSKSKPNSKNFENKNNRKTNSSKSTNKKSRNYKKPAKKPKSKPKKFKSK